jgi:hypothetical protein
MSLSLNLDEQKGRLLLSALQAFLMQARGEVEIAEQQFDAAQQRLGKAQAVFTEYDKLVKETAEGLGIDLVFTDPPFVSALKEHLKVNLHSEKRTSFREELRRGKPPVKRRETVDETTLKLLTEGNTFKTVDQVLDMLFAFYGKGEIKEKTVKNALWSLSGVKIQKYYSRNNKAYMYGLLEWFDQNGDPLLEYLPIAEEESQSSNSILFPE